MREENYQFLSLDAEHLAENMEAYYQSITGVKVLPGSEEALFLRWMASALLHERALCNYAGNQNLPSRASGASLDALGEQLCGCARPQAKASACTVRFSISAPQASAVLVPAGTRVTDSASAYIWATTHDALISPGETSVDVPVLCQSLGARSNGYTPGEINTIVDLFPYFAFCENTTTSDGGAERADDQTYYELIRASMDAFSYAGAKGGYYEKEMIM